jgi:putative nucleotidyltransferase with HDIG domain
MEANDPYSRLCAYRAAKLAAAIAKIMGLDEEYARRIELGGMLHDIGRIGVPDSILHKNGKLTQLEVEAVRRHPEIGVNILTPLLGNEKVVMSIVKHHHERWDGEGYPSRLRGEDIPIEARIISVADAFIAMVSRRAYRKASTPDEALRVLSQGAGVQWDPKIVSAIMTLPLSTATDISSQIPTC